MKKTQGTLLLAFVIAVTLGINFSIFAQQQNFQVGQQVEVTISSSRGWQPCTVSENNPGLSYMRVKCDAHMGAPGGVFMVGRSDARPKAPLPQQANPAANQNTQQPASRPPQGGQPTAQQPPQAKNGNPYKVGDRVLASPYFKDSDWWNCSVTEITGPTSLRTWCEPKNGLAGGNFSLTTAWVKPAPGNAMAHDSKQCSYTPVAGSVSNTAPASEGLFKRVIYEHYMEDLKIAHPTPLKVGITFQSFTMGQSYKNTLDNYGPVQDGAPLGATIYSVKAKYVWCRQYQSTEYRYVMETPFACFKDKMNRWDCPVDGVPKHLEQKDYPLSAK